MQSATLRHGTLLHCAVLYTLLYVVGCGYSLCGATERTALLLNCGTDSACFHIVGFDVMLDCTGAPTLLEINCNPSLSLESVYPIDGAQVL